MDFRLTKEAQHQFYPPWVQAGRERGADTLYATARAAAAL
jgi:hypothetical protein